MITVRIRAATPDDAPGIARVHVDSWRTTYAGIISAEFLANLSYEKSEARNRAFTTEPGVNRHFFVAGDERNDLRQAKRRAPAACPAILRTAVDSRWL